MKKATKRPFPSVPKMDDSFWDRFSNRRAFYLLLFLILLGVASGASVSLFGQLFEGRWVLPLHFSGIPVVGSGFVSCFTTLLFNALIGLLVLFLLGMTTFGVFAVPAFLFFRGVTVGIGVASFLWKDELIGLAQSALLYTPAAAAGGLLLLLFGGRALIFSRNLAKAGFSSREGSLDLRCYFQDLLLFLSCAAGISVLGSLPAVVCEILL